MRYRRTGRSGLRLPEVSLGLWHNFGDTNPISTQRAILLDAFDHGVTHFDLANNYGPPYGAAERNFGITLQRDLRPFRDELVISSKAGYDMWPGPYGDHGSRKYLIASADQSLARTGLDYFDVFYHHRPDPETPIEETAGALAQLVRQGKALYVGVSNYSPEQTEAIAAVLADLGTPLLIHQPRYSMFDRTVEDGLLETVARLGVGSIAFSPLAQGLLTDRYLDGTVPEGSRASLGAYLSPSRISDVYLERARGLNAIAEARGQSLAQLAVSWILRRPEVTSVLIGASSVRQLRANLGALGAAPLSDEELARIDRFAVHGTAL
nr:aldo/keto reductase [Amnibacterium kyonggiense]